MNLVVHQFRKDVRQFRMLIAAWWGFLILDAALNLMAAGEFRPGHEASMGGGFKLTQLMADGATLVATVFPWVFVSLVVLADSTGRSEGFLSTRPFPRRDLWLAKILFAAVIVVLPQGLAEALHLVACEVPARWLVHGIVERVGLAALGVTVAAGFAGIWPDVRGWLTGLGATLLGVGLALLVWLLLGVEWTSEGGGRAARSHDPSFGQVLLGVVVMGGVSGWIAIGVARRRWSGFVRHAAAVASGGLALVACLATPWDPWKPRGVDAEAVRQWFSSDGVEVPLPSMTTDPDVTVQSADAPTVFDVSLSPRIPTLPADLSVAWWCEDGVWGREGGEGVTATGMNPRPDVLVPRLHASQREAGAIGGLFGGGTALLRGVALEGPNDPHDAFLGCRIDVGAARELAARHARLRLRLGGHVYRWERVAEMPLRTGTTAGGTGETWTVVDMNSGAGANPGSMRLVLRQRRLALATTTDPHYSAAGRWPSDRYEFVVFRPDRHQAIFPVFSAPLVERARHTACHDSYALIVFSHYDGQRNLLETDDDAPATLVVFRRVYLGSGAADWESPEYILAQASPPRNTANPPERTTRTSAQLQAELMQIPAPGNPTREAVGEFVVRVLDLLNSREIPSDHLESVAVSRLAPFVPAQLDLFLEGIAALPGRGSRTLLRAVAEGVSSDQRTVVIGAVPRIPSLATVLLARGWMEEARGSLATLLQRPGRLPTDALVALAWLEDPATYPRLLAELEASQEPALYRMLRELPGIQAGLDASVRRIWGGRRYRLPSVPTGDWQIALLHGLPESLDSVLRYQQDPESSEWSTGETAGEWMRVLRDVVATDDLSAAQRHDDGMFRRWMMARVKGPFLFDPARRLFVWTGATAEVL